MKTRKLISKIEEESVQKYMWVDRIEDVLGCCRKDRHLKKLLTGEQMFTRMRHSMSGPLQMSEPLITWIYRFTWMDELDLLDKIDFSI